MKLKKVLTNDVRKFCDLDRNKPNYFNYFDKRMELKIKTPETA